MARFLGDRWPTALAVLTAVLVFGGGKTDEEVRGFAEILPLLPLLYLVVAKLQRRGATWPLLAASFAVIFLLRTLDVLSPAAVFSAAALVVLVWSVLDGHLARSGTFQVQALGMLVFGGLGLAGLVVDPGLGRYLVAAGWLFHGVWDFVHLWLGKVVARSFAEWCGVVDVWVAVVLVFGIGLGF
ncbi:hypothetical protein [Nocardiopsis sp. Huas11]|uniref:hypothetical protein n=1 Tax=Nocardiopsis sp. Huas11 TaxID=2183912 RepID=UPI000EB102D2|nr:hypothetical protein [Nocardiopsis sp. Huas11]